MTMSKTWEVRSVFNLGPTCKVMQCWHFNFTSRSFKDSGQLRPFCLEFSCAFFGSSSSSHSPKTVAIVTVVHSIIPLLVEPSLSAITWSNHFLDDFITLFKSLWKSFDPLIITRVVQFKVCCHLQVPITTFESGWSLDFAQLHYLGSFLCQPFWCARDCSSVA